MRSSKIPATLRGAGITPACPDCGHNEHVIRMWIGRKKVWICDYHYKVSSTKRKEASIIQRMTGRMPEADTFSVSEILPNRAARRRR